MHARVVLEPDLLLGRSTYLSSNKFAILRAGRRAPGRAYLLVRREPCGLDEQGSHHVPFLGRARAISDDVAGSHISFSRCPHIAGVYGFRSLKTL